MRYPILIITMLGLLLSLSAKEILISPVEYRVLEAHEYDLDLTTSVKLEKIFAILEFDILREDLKDADHYSMFLACCAGIDRLKINGKNALYSLTTGLHPLHFVPQLWQLELIQEKGPVTCYSFDPTLFDQEINTVYIEYSFPMPPWKIRADGAKALHIGSIPFFYPRNFYIPAYLSVTINTTIYYSMENADEIIDKGSSRIIRKKIIDTMDEDITFDLIKVLN